MYIYINRYIYIPIYTYIYIYIYIYRERERDTYIHKIQATYDAVIQQIKLIISEKETVQMIKCKCHSLESYFK